MDTRNLIGDSQAQYGFWYFWYSDWLANQKCLSSGVGTAVGDDVSLSDKKKDFADFTLFEVTFVHFTQRC